MILENDNQNYYKVKKILKTNKDNLSIQDKTSVYVNLHNFCSKKISHGELIFEVERFENYKEELVEKTYMMSNGYMSPVFYRNAVSCALKLKRISLG